MAKFLKRGEHILGVDIGGTKAMAMVLDHSFKCVGRAKKKMRCDKPGEKAEDRVIRAMRDALEDAGIEQVAGIGAGSPGPLDPDTGVIIDTPNLAWKNFPLAQTLSDAFGGIPCVIDNDVNMGTYGEWHFGEVKNCKNVVGIFPGTGIGGGLIIGGKMFRGFTGAAGEVGHMTVEPGGPYCGCGKRGCLEALASRVAIAAEVAALSARGDAPYIFENCGTDLGKIRSSTLAKAIQNGETMVEGVVRRAAYCVGVAVGNLINILSPEAVVLGGGLVEAMEALYLEEVERAVKEHAMPFLRKKVRVVPARLADDAVAMGGAMLIAEHLA
ncbi:MAG: ROK family protein [Nitrospiraceae bacterium]|nr:ROK family protein [Nitrospiraceae bacterium]